MFFADHDQGHGTLDAIYSAVAKSCEVRGWDGVDLLIIGGDFQVSFKTLAALIADIEADVQGCAQCG